MKNSLRSKEMTERYAARVRTSEGCELCPKPALKEFTHWKITVNDFPYDVIAQEHHMIMPKEHVKEDALSAAALEEYKAIKADYLQSYDYLIEGTQGIKSIPEHFHIHLVVGKGPQ